MDWAGRKPTACCELSFSLARLLSSEAGAPFLARVRKRPELFPCSIPVPFPLPPLPLLVPLLWLATLALTSTASFFFSSAKLFLLLLSPCIPLSRYLTHSSWIILWPTQFVFLKLRKRRVAWRAFWRQHLVHLRATAAMVETQRAQPAGTAVMRRSPAPFLLRMTAVLTAALTFAAASWYVAVDMTTPSDLTAIYNCSAFFAYAFSVPLLKDRLRVGKALSVAVAIAGVLVVAYGDAAGGGPAPKKSGLGSHGGSGKQLLPSTRAGGAAGTNVSPAVTAAGARTAAAAAAAVAAATAEAKNRALGNIIIGVGSVLYGLYEVLYKKLACPPANTSPGRGMIFANTVGSLIGAFTLLVLWIPLVILHVTGIEKFELPHGRAAWVLSISIFANAGESVAFPHHFSDEISPCPSSVWSYGPLLFMSYTLLFYSPVISLSLRFLPTRCFQ